MILQKFNDIVCSRNLSDNFQGFTKGKYQKLLTYHTFLVTYQQTLGTGRSQFQCIWLPLTLLLSLHDRIHHDCILANTHRE